MANELEENPFIFSIGKQATCLSSCLANENMERSRWLAGTNIVRGQNEIIAIEFDEDAHELKSSRWTFESQIRKIAWIFGDLVAVSSGASSAVYSLAGLDADQLSNRMNATAQKKFDLMQKTAVSIVKDQKNENIMAVAANELMVYDLKSQMMKKSFTFNSAAVTCAALNPLTPEELVIGSKDGKIQCMDLRNPKSSFDFDAHTLHVTDMDYNQNKPNIIVSSGKDCQIKIWDLRNPKSPLKEFTDHTHWVQSVQFNPFHDQLILSTSSDNRVNLYNMISVSSSQFKRNEKDLLDELHGTTTTPLEEDLVIKTTDELVTTFDQHGETAYAAIWSLNDPWVFASLSYDGNIVINCVPAEHKYKIIL